MIRFRSRLRRIQRRFAPAVLALVAASAARAQPVQVTEEDLDIAIKRAVEFLWSQQRPDGGWDEGEFSASYPGGVSSLITYALLEAGESQHDPRMIKAVNFIREVEGFKSTYAHAFRALVWCRLDPEKYQRDRNGDAGFLLRCQHESGGWGYPGTWGSNVTGGSASDYIDNSNSQIAMLALWEASLIPGNEIPRSAFRKAEKYWLEAQNIDGGWGYHPSWGRHAQNSASYGSMSAAGLATLAILYDRVHVGDEGGRVRPRPDSRGKKPKKLEELLGAIELATTWLSNHFDVDSAGNSRNHWASKWLSYYHYSIDRAGVATGRKYLGGKQWYPALVQAVLRRQQPDGSWGDHVNTSFSLLSLLKGRAPIVFNKLDYGEEDALFNSRDASKLTTWMSRSFEQPFGWQIVEPHKAAGDLLDAPIVLINGLPKDGFSEAIRKALIDYVWMGGTIVVGPVEKEKDFAERAQELFKGMFPELHSETINADHVVYSMQYRLDEPFPIIGLSDSCRTRVFIFETDISRLWHQGRWLTERPAFELGANLYLYAAGRGTRQRTRLRPMFQPVSKSASETWTIARGRHEGDWSIVPSVISQLSNATAQSIGVAFREEIIDPADADPRKTPLLWLTGDAAFGLSADQLEGMKRFMQHGGTVLVDAANGSPAFDKAFKAFVASEFGEDALQPIKRGHPLITGTLSTMGSNLRSLRIGPPLGVDQMPPEETGVSAVRFGTGLGLIYVEPGLACPCEGLPRHGRPSYDTETARALMANVILSAYDRSPPG